MKLLKLLYHWLVRIALLILVSSTLVVVLYRFVPVPLTPLMVIRLAEQASDGKPLTLKKDWVPLTEMSANMPIAVVSSEDQLFLEHSGFDFKAIEKAMDYNEKKKGKKIKGASTISQQTAKNVFLWPGRSWVRKGFEVYFTFMIELIWSKERIMEVYLNVIEMGNGIYGTQAAAQEYFNKNAKDLNKQECAAIASVLPNPRKYSVKKPTAYLKHKQQWILRQMNYLDEKVIFE